MTALPRTYAPHRAALAILLSAAVAACGDIGTEIRGAEIAGYLPQVSVNGVTGQLIAAAPPAPGSGPTVSGPAALDGITGGSVQLDMTASAAFQTVAVRMDGVEGYYLVTLSEAASQGEMVVTVGSAPPELDFAYEVAVAGTDGVFGPYQPVGLSVTEVIRGDIQVSVTWSTLADVDLHVIDPNGEEIYYGNRSSASGGELDLDANAACSTSNIFQENIGWERGTAPRGEYTIRVDYWDACGETETDFVVTLSMRPGIPPTPVTPGAAVRTFTGSFTGSGTGGAAGAGTTITKFVF